MSVTLVALSDQDSANPRFRLEGALDFSTAAGALAEIREKIEQSTHLGLDLAGVTSANSAGLSVLIESQACAKRAGKSIEFINLPDSLQKIAEVCQVDALLA